MQRLKNKINHFFPALALFSLEFLIVMSVCLVSFLVFLFFVNKIFYNKEHLFDSRVFELVENIKTPGLTNFMKTITFFASGSFVFVAAFIISFYYLVIRKHHWYSLKIPVVCLGSISLNVLLKLLFNRPRPLFPHLVEVSGFSFPSGHAMVSFSFYGLLIYLLYISMNKPVLKWIGIVFLFLLMHLIGFSRVYLGVHFASDVLAGFALGTIWLILSIFILKKIETFSKNRIQLRKG